MKLKGSCHFRGLYILTRGLYSQAGGKKAKILLFLIRSGQETLVKQFKKMENFHRDIYLLYGFSLRKLYSYLYSTKYLCVLSLI